MKKRLLSAFFISIMLLISACGKQEVSVNNETEEPEMAVETVTTDNTIEASDNENVEKIHTDENWALIPMVMVDGQMYYSTGKESSIEARCGMMDGEITSTVDVSEIPTEDNQSNFGAGYGYQFASEDTIEILMEDGKWYVYEKGSGEGFFDEAIETEEAPASIRVENPSWEYYIAENTQSDTKPYTINLIEETANEIIDTEEWLAEYKSDYNAAKKLDGKYHAVIENNGTLVNIFEYDTCIAGLDFTDYMYAPDLVEADKDFVDERVQEVKIVNDILYASVFHYTYAESAPSNAYIVAIGLEDYSVIWKSQPLVCNSHNFEIVDDIIFTGYGFTAEPDYLFQIDRLTGCVLEQYKIKSKADYIIYIEDKLYVRTYNTDYVFEITK